MSRRPAAGSIDRMSRSDIDDTVRDMWSTRPHRRKDDRKIAGVAAAIGRRYRIDPVLVRVAFVVTTVFGGVGIMLYLLGWLFLPQEGDEVSAAEALIGHGRSSMSKPLTIVLAIALIPASSGLFTANMSALFSAAAVAAAVFLLHRHRATVGEPGTGAAVTAPVGFTADPAMAAGQAGGPQAGTTATGTAGGPGTPGGAGTAGAPGGTTPPAWDPLGVAPFAWDLPEPTPAGPPPAPEPKRRRSAVTPVTLALALIVAGTGAIVAMTNSAVGAAEVLAATLAVVGAGLVVGSFARGGRGLIAVAIPLAVATYVTSVVPFDRFGPQDGFGDRTWRASTVTDVQREYRLSAGDATLDLSQLRLSDTDVVTTTVQLGVGDLKVVLPPDADVDVRCEATGVGDLKCLGDERDGRHPIVAKSDPGSDGPGGGKIVLNATVGAGDVKVTRDE